MIRFALALLPILPAAGGAPTPVPTIESLADRPIEVDIYDLTDIVWQPGDPLPQNVLDLDGKRVVINGYMHQSITARTSEFPLVNDACQCTGNLMPHHFIEVDLGPRETEPIPGSFEVIGTLDIGEIEEDGYCVSVYRLRGKIY